MCHKQRTGKGLKISEEIVMREEMYEEEDDLPSHLRYNLHLPKRFQEYAQIHTAMHLGLNNPNQDRIHREFEQHFGSLMGGSMSGHAASRTISDRGPIAAATAALYNMPPQQVPSRRGSVQSPMSPAVASNAASYHSSPAAMQHLQSPAVSPGGSFFPNFVAPMSATNATFSPMAPMPGLHHQRSRSLPYCDHADILAASQQNSSFMLQGVPTGQQRKSRRRPHEEAELMYQPDHYHQMARTSSGASSVLSAHTIAGPPMKRRRSEQSNHSSMAAADQRNFTPRLPRNISDIMHSRQQIFQMQRQPMQQTTLFDPYVPLGYVPTPGNNPLYFSGPAAGHRMSEPGLSYSAFPRQQPKKPSQHKHKAKSGSRSRAKPKKAATSSGAKAEDVKYDFKPDVEATPVPKEDVKEATIESDIQGEPAAQGEPHAYEDMGFKMADLVDDDAIAAFFLQDTDMGPPDFEVNNMINNDFDVGPFDIDDFVDFPASQPDSQ